MIILSTHGRAAARKKVLDLAARVDGLVVLGHAIDDDLVVEVISGGLPVVTLARPPIPGADAVSADNLGSATALGRHLLQHGHRRFVLLGDPQDSADVEARWVGLRAVLAEPGSRTVVEELPSRGFDVEAGSRAAAQVLDLATRPDAVVCANDEIALGLLGAARDAGLAVPGELAITGWDDIMAARYAELTTVRQPLHDLGATAARFLDDLIAGRRAEPRNEVLPTELIVRSSSSPRER